jgi:hypothetical protein
MRAMKHLHQTGQATVTAALLLVSHQDHIYTLGGSLLVLLLSLPAFAL